MRGIVRHDLTGDDLPALPFPLRRLALWERRPEAPAARPLLYVHGATFPISCAFTFPFDGLSWADDLAQRGFWPWGLDFAGFGGSPVHWPEIDSAGGPFGRAAPAAKQIEAALRYIRKQTGADAVDLIAHSWGTVAAGLFATQRPASLGRLVLFGPIVCRDGPAPSPKAEASRLVTPADQYKRFTGYLPAGQEPVLEGHHLDSWGEAYLDSDPESRSRNPPAVRIPAGPAADIADLWSGRNLYDPQRIAAPVAILRGAWDSLCTDEDAARLCANLTAAPDLHDIKLPKGTHVMHLESGRTALWDSAAAVLSGESGSMRGHAGD